MRKLISGSDSEFLKTENIFKGMNHVKVKKIAIIYGVEINIISKEDLLKKQKESGSAKDLNDLENLA